MNYFPLTAEDRQKMLAVIGKREINELFSCFPESCSFSELEKIGPALSEIELNSFFHRITSKNSFRDYRMFIGGGAYQHFIPEVVNYLSAKGEFVTPYTPYQPEVSQGSLQALFEYQTMVCQLTGLDVANSSLYDGGTATAEAVLLALRKKNGANRVLLSRTLHPEYRQIIDTYLQNLGIGTELVEIDENGSVDMNDLQKKLSADVAAFVFQSPNFLGIIENASKISELVHQQQIYSVQVVAEAFAFGLIKPPADCLVDICVGEMQSFGQPLGFGGPYLGFMAAKEEFLRQLPGRIVGETVDLEGKRGYVLTLSTREQHIKRERATSNICTNQAWCAIRAAIYLATIGREGLKRLSLLNHQNCAYFVERVKAINGVKIKYQRNFYNEVVLEVIRGDVQTLYDRLIEKKIIPGILLKNYYPRFKNALLINFTELHTPEMITELVSEIGAAL